MSYLSDLKSKLSPEQYNALIKPLMYTANEAFGGKVQDYQAQLLLPLDTSKVQSKFQLSPVKYETVYDGEGGSYQVKTGGTPIGLEPITEQRGDSGDVVIGYKTPKPVNVNGVPVYAEYDANGKLTGYTGDQATRTWVNGKQSISGKWDAEGKPAPNSYTSTSNGFRGLLNDVMSDPILGTAANIAASYFGGPLGTAALGVAQGKSPEDIAKAAALSYAAGQAIEYANANAVGGVNGPDNIDVGGGWSPAAGATAAELEAARLALETAAITPKYVAPAPTEVAPPAPAPTVETITKDIANAADNIDAGGGWNPATGTGDAATASAALANPPKITNPTVNDIVNKISGDANAPDNIDAGGGWSPATGATAAELASAKAAMASTGWTLNQALDAVRAGLLVNAITGDPLGLSGDKGGGSAPASTGFAMVPIPAEWNSPTYAASSAPIDLNSIFSNQNMLGGTQWQGLPSQNANMSFNDIFAARQQAPMGSPVDINQIVSSILGQAATSSKPT